MAGHPDYERCTRLSVAELKVLTREEILFSYLIIHAEFEFPAGTKYPSIPCYVDENCTVYPLSGSCVLTGAEYLLALDQKCSFDLHDIYHTPFKQLEYRDLKPFASIIKIVQEKRREHPKGTVSNLMYKELGNSIYGSVVRGIGNKRKFDIRSKGTIRMVGDELTNPLIASWTTAFIRSIIGECLHAINEIEGLVVSVTTDGFITNIEGLESKLTEKFLFGEFKKIRMMLSDENTGLEIKNAGKGIIVWSTRGQLGIESKIIASTGFQHRVYENKTKLLEGFLETMRSESKSLEFIQSRLRSATDIYKKGGHVTMIHRDQIFRMHFDNRRELAGTVTTPGALESLIDSQPLKSIAQGRNLRTITKISKTKAFGRYNSVGKSKNKYKNTEEVAVRHFLKGLLSTPPLYNITCSDLYGYQSIVDYVKGYNPSIPVSKSGLAMLKLRIKAGTEKRVPLQKTKGSESFIKYVQQKFQSFDVASFYGINESS